MITSSLMLRYLFNCLYSPRFTTPILLFFTFAFAMFLSSSCGGEKTSSGLAEERTPEMGTFIHFFRDGINVLIGDTVGKIKKYDLHTKSVVGELSSTGSYSADSFSPGNYRVSDDGRFLLSGLRHSTNVDMFNLETEQKTISVESSGSSDAVIVSPNGRYLAVGFYDKGLVRIYDLSSNKMIGDIELRYRWYGISYADKLEEVHFSADSEKISALPKKGKSVVIFDVNTLKSVSLAHEDSPYASAFTKYGRLVSASRNDKTGMLQIDNIANIGSESIKISHGTLLGHAISNGHKFVVSDWISKSDEYLLSVIPIENDDNIAERVKRIVFPTVGIRGIQKLISPDEKYIAIKTHGNVSIYSIDPSHGELSEKYQLKDWNDGRIAEGKFSFSDDGRYFTLSHLPVDNSSVRVSIVDLNNGRKKTFVWGGGRGAKYPQIMFAPNGKQATVLRSEQRKPGGRAEDYYDKFLSIIDLETWNHKDVKVDHFVLNMTGISSDSKFAGVETLNSIEVIELSTRGIKNFGTGSNVGTSMFSPYGPHLVFTKYDGSVFIVDPSSDTE